MKKLDGKVAIVTGGASGIGRATAELYAEHGATVVIADFRKDVADQTASAICSKGGVAVPFRVDVADGDSVSLLVDETEKQFGALHIMTANAGASGGLGAIHELDIDQWRPSFDVLFFGVLYSFKYAIPAILRSGGGSMTTTGSIAANIGLPYVSNYCAAKAGVLGLVRSIASEQLGRIRVNAVAPGETRTDLPISSARWAKELNGDGAVAQAAPPTSLKRWGREADPMEIAAVHLFLASDDASFITGQNIVADGGKSIQPIAGTTPGN